MVSAEKRFQPFVEFLVGFIKELNDMAREGGVVLVEGKRDARALLELGYTGSIVTASALNLDTRVIREAKLMIILTDLDTEGRHMAARYTKLFSRAGIGSTLVARRRLSMGSHGTFLHVENLIRFAPLQTNLDSGYQAGMGPEPKKRDRPIPFANRSIKP